jgi:hypothetical protein
MADNSQNIKDSREELDKFNDDLRTSISLSRTLSDNIKNFSKATGEWGVEERKLVESSKALEKSLAKTLSLSDKIITGQAKQKEIATQLNILQQKYTEYLADSQKENSKIIEAGKNKEDLLKKIAQAEEKASTFGKSVKSQLEELGVLTEQLRIQNSIIESGSKYLKKGAEDQAKYLRDKIRDEDYTLKLQEKELSLVEKEIAEDKRQLEIAKSITSEHEDLVGLLEQEIARLKIISENYKELTLFEKLRSKDIKKQAEGFKELFSTIASIGSLFKPLTDFAFKISSQTAQLQKNLVLSQDEARNLRQDFNAMAVSSNDIAITTNRLVEANTALGKQLGFSSEFTEDLNKQFVKLTKQLGLSEEAAGGLAKLSIATGATLEDTKNIAYETTQGLSSQYGIQLNQREVLEEIGKLSGQTLAMFKASPKALTEAVAQAKLLGTTLDQTQKQASSLLNFETSIENELQAELLTGQQLNLERARTAALMGDQTTVMKELANQNIDFNKFSNMNVIAQDKVAAALGLSSNELSDQLLKQQYLNKSREEIVALAGEEVANRVEAISAQDKFNLAMEKMQDAIGKIVGGPLGKFVDMVASAAESSAVIYGTLVAMAGISLVKLISSLVTVAATLTEGALASTALGTALSGGIIAGLVIAAIGAVAAALGAFSSEAEPIGDGLFSKGKTIISTKEGGIFKPSANDDIAVAPGLGDMINNSNRQTVIAQDNSEMLNKLDAFISKAGEIASGINSLNNKKSDIYVDSQKLGSIQVQGNYNLA